MPVCPKEVNEANYDAWNFNNFPNEVIEKIFSFLTQNQLGQISRVCKKWNAMTKSPVLWRKVDVKIFCSSDEEVDAVVKYFMNGLPSCVTFIRLEFSDRTGICMYLDFEELCLKLHQNSPSVETLILENSGISTILPEVINVCSQFLQGLKKLVLRYCCFKDYSGTEFECQFEDYSGTAELRDNSIIEVLDLSLSNFSNSRKIQFSKLPSLKELRLAQTIVDVSWFVGDTSFLNHLQVLDLGWTFANIFTAILRHGQNLKELYVCGLRLDDRDFSFNNPVFPHLQAICLSDTLVTCEALVSLVRSCTSLVSVYVDERLARSFSEHPFVVANRCKSGIVKGIDWGHHHRVDYSYN